MEKLVILSNVPNMVIILNVTEEDSQIIEEKYEDNTEAWMSGEGIEDKLGINLNNCSFMWMGSDVTIKEMNIVK